METTPELELGAGHRREQQPCSPSSEVWLGSCDKCHLPYRTHPPQDISKPLELKCARMECTGMAVMTPLEGFPEKSDDEKWRDHFVMPIAAEMKRRGIGEMRIKLTEKGTAVFELLPENERGLATARCGSNQLETLSPSPAPTLFEGVEPPNNLP